MCSPNICYIICIFKDKSIANRDTKLRLRNSKIVIHDSDIL